MPEPFLEVNDVAKEFGGVNALNGVSLEVRPREIMAIIGPNGAGKTTLFNLISGFYDVTGGDIRFDGASILQMQTHQIARLGIGRTFQNLQTFDEMTILENAMIGCHIQGKAGLWQGALRSGPARNEEDQLHQKAYAALERVGLDDRANQYAGHLTVGQRRLLEVARVIAMAPRIILLDEPVAGLTTRETETLGRLIQRLREELDLTVVLIEHDMTVVMDVSDRVAVLDHGRKIAQGLPEQVQKDPEVIAAYLGREQ